MDRIILGDNQFFGISHMSEEKGMVRARRFQDNNNIIDVLDAAYDCGIHAFTFSTHARVQELCDHFRANPQRYADLRLYPALPYAYKYADLVNEKGIVGAIVDVVVSDNTAGQIAGMIARGGTAVLTQNPTEIMKLLIDVEMKMFRGLNVKVVFLQNIVTDLFLGLGWKDVFMDFITYIENKYQVQAGFITLNMPRLVDFLSKCGIREPVICSAINKIGFQMNPDIASYEETLRSRPFHALAMSIMAAGAIPPREAIEYIVSLDNIESIVFGASSKRHVEESMQLLSQHV